jgi:hypothetical protein
MALLARRGATRGEARKGEEEARKGEKNEDTRKKAGDI